MTSFLVIWLLSSVASALFVFPTRTRQQTLFQDGRPGDREALLQCQKEVEGLFDQVENSTLSLDTLAAGYEGDVDPDAVARRWVESHTRWFKQWQDTGYRCRFRELRDHGLGASYDHLAWVHARLGELHDTYVAQLNHFMARHASEVEEIRRALDSSRQTFEEQRGIAGSTTTSPGGAANPEGHR